MIRHLPPLRDAKLKAILNKHPKPDRKPLRDDSRKQGVNDFLVSRVCFCTNFDEFLDVARTWNEELPDHYDEPPLEDAILGPVVS